MLQPKRANRGELIVGVCGSDLINIAHVVEFRAHVSSIKNACPMPAKCGLFFLCSAAPWAQCRRALSVTSTAPSTPACATLGRRTLAGLCSRAAAR